MRRSPRALARDGAAGALRRLARIRLEYGGDAAARKLALLRAIDRADLGAARRVVALHETLCFLRAYPDDARVLRAVERMLARFDRRRDLARHRDTLASSGIAGTAIRFRFFHAMARWLTARWPAHLAVEWKAFEQADLLERLLPVLVHFAETPALDEIDLPLREWLRRMKGPDETEAAFLIRRFEALATRDFAREILYDELDVPMVLSPAPDPRVRRPRGRARAIPSRTGACARSGPVVFQREAISRARPDLRAEIARPPAAVRALSPRAGERYIDLAREAMVTRQRDLDVFAYGDPRDVRLVDAGGWLEFACIGAVQERRLLLEAVYGFLTLKNGVPIGYVLASALFRSSEIAYNVFDTYRGVEAGAIYGRVVSMIHHLFGAETFTIYPYQLGEGNDEAIESGAWWFYYKMGFRPRAAAARRVVRAELATMRRRPAHRSSAATLRRLATHPLFFDLGARRRDVIGELPLANVGLHVTRYLAARFGSDRERGARQCAEAAARLLGLRSPRDLTPGERVAWDRWAPVVAVLPGVARWSAAERRALAAVIRAKGGRSESEFVRAFDAHGKLGQAIARLARSGPGAR